MSINKTICRACESGSLINKTSEEEFFYKDIKFVVDDYHYSVCDECGYEVVTTSDRKLNDKLIREEHRSIEGLISAKEIKRIRKKFGLTQHDAAEIFGGGANAFSKYENDEVIQSTPMDRLLRIADLIPSVFPSLVIISSRSALKFKSKQQFSKMSCDYGECEIADSKNLPNKIINLGKFTKFEKRAHVQSTSDDWLNSAAS